jgi:hypothetical protein
MLLSNEGFALVVERCDKSITKNMMKDNEVK